MGALILHQWARLVALGAGTYCAWASIWAFFFRKFFWDMIGGVLGPAGLIPPESSNFFITIIVTFPLVQIITLINGLLTIMIEYPLPPFNKESLPHRSHMFKAGFYFWCAFWAIMVYQTVDSSLYYLIAMGIYVKAQLNGEVFEVEGKRRGGGGGGKVMV